MLHIVLASRILICYLPTPCIADCDRSHTRRARSWYRKIDEELVAHDIRPSGSLNQSMVATINASLLTSTRALIERRQEQVVELIRRLIEIESPSGDEQGSLAVNQLLESESREIPSVATVERIASPNVESIYCFGHFAIAETEIDPLCCSVTRIQFMREAVCRLT